MRKSNESKNIQLEEMSAFFNRRSESYDEVHVSMIKDGAESKRVVADFLPEGTGNLLDIGIGTGLELEAIFRRFPDMRVTGIDIAAEMMAKIKEKYPQKDVTLLNMSYFDYDYKPESFDAVLSVMTLHHYTHEVKTALYRRIYEAVRKGGIYIECDYMLAGKNEFVNRRRERELFREYDRLVSSQGLDNGLEYHFDTPCTLKNQIKMLKSAGFKKVEKLWQSGTTVLLRAKK